MMEKHQNTYIIAEIGNNHNGSVSKAIELIDMSASSELMLSNFRASGGWILLVQSVPHQPTKDGM